MEMYGSCHKKKIVTSRDVVFDEVYTSYSNLVCEENPEFVPLFYSSLDLIPVETDSSERGRLEFTTQNNTAQGEGMPRRTSRQRKLPIHLNDYEVQLNQCTVTSYFFGGRHF